MFHTLQRQRLPSRIVAVTGGRERLADTMLGFAEGDPVLGALGPRNARHHFRKIQADGVVVLRGHGAGCSKESLSSAVRFDQGNFLLRTARQPQIVQGFVIDRKESAGGPVLRRHIGDGRLVRQGKMIQPITEEFDEFSDHSLASKYFHHGQHQIRCGCPLGQGACELETHHLRNQHGNGLTEHGGLRLNTAHPPTQHTESIHHRRVGVRSNDSIRVSNLTTICFTAEYDTRQIFNIDLMDDSRRRGHYAKIAESRLAPA